MRTILVMLFILLCAVMSVRNAVGALKFRVRGAFGLACLSM